MGALGRLAPASGISAMQQINVVVLNPGFLSVFAGTAALSGIIGVAALLRWSEPGALLLLAGAVLYVAGSFLVTMFLNVPLNDALMAVTPDSAEGASFWARYLSDWTLWNHVRTAASFAAMAAFIVALCLHMAGRAAA